MKSQVSPKLVAKVQAATFNESWIPDASYDEYAKRTSVTKSTNNSKKTSGFGWKLALTAFIVESKALINASTPMLDKS